MRSPPRPARTWPSSSTTGWNSSTSPGRARCSRRPAPAGHSRCSPSRAEARPITSQGFLTVTPNYTFADCPKPDIIVLPGGATQRALKDPRVVEWVKKASADAEVTLSVCTGAFILGEGRAAGRQGGDDPLGVDRVAQEEVPEDEGARRPAVRGQRQGGDGSRRVGRDRRLAARRRTTARQGRGGRRPPGTWSTATRPAGNERTQPPFVTPGSQAGPASG